MRHACCVFWVSQHKPLPIQRQALKDLYDTEALRIIWYKGVFNPPEEIIRCYQQPETFFRDIVVDVPALTLKKLCQGGLTPLLPEMEAAKDTAQAHVKSKTFGNLKFVRFIRVSDINIQTVPV